MNRKPQTLNEFKKQLLAEKDKFYKKGFKLKPSKYKKMKFWLYFIFPYRMKVLYGKIKLFLVTFFMGKKT